MMIISGTVIAILLAIALRRSHVLAVVLASAGLVAAFVSLRFAQAVAPRRVSAMLIVDSYALFYEGLIIAATLGTVILCYGYFKKREEQNEEAYVLILLATLGAAVLVSSSHFVSLFLGLETLSVPLYVLISYLPARRSPVEAGIKYLILAASSTAFLLFGMALIYAGLGTMEFSQIAARIGTVSQRNLTLVIPGVALMLPGIGFKLGVVPFHLWVPDVYEGAPAPVTTYIATVSKGSMVALLLRFFHESGAHDFAALGVVISVMAIASMIAGNLLAVLQDNVKRILAYSSIAHFGYLLVAFLTAGAMGLGAATFYVVAYFVTILGALGVVTALSSRERDADRLEDYQGLFRTRPVLAVFFMASLLSLAGIPLTVGFPGKFSIVAVGVASSNWAPVIVLVLSSVIGLFYYIRIIVAMFTQPAETGEVLPSKLGTVIFSDRLVLAVTAFLLIWFGVFPPPLLDLIKQAVLGIG